MEIKIYSVDKKEVGKVGFPEEAFSEKPRKGLIYQVIVQQAANRRQGNADVKNRHEVSGSTRKIYRQKGTGKARHGDIKAPLFVGGGRAFGPRTRDWVSHVPEKVRRGALSDLLVMKKNEEKLLILDQWEMAKPKTKEAAALFHRFGIVSGLVLLPGKDEKIQKSVRNLPSFKVACIDSLESRDLLRYEHLVLTRQSYDRLIHWLGAE